MRVWTRSLKRKKRAPSLRSYQGPRAQMRLCCHSPGAAAIGAPVTPVENSPTWLMEALSRQMAECMVKLIFIIIYYYYYKYIINV